MKREYVHGYGFAEYNFELAVVGSEERAHETINGAIKKHVEKYPNACGLVDVHLYKRQGMTEEDVLSAADHVIEMLEEWIDESDKFGHPEEYRKLDRDKVLPIALDLCRTALRSVEIYRVGDDVASIVVNLDEWKRKNEP